MTRTYVGEPNDGPKQIDRYEILTRWATGGMAELFLAREQGIAGLERLVIVKRILPHLADQQSFVDMFLREARIVARLSHPNVVQIYDLGQENGTYHLAMEYIHGSTVRELLLLLQQQKRRPPLSVVVTIIEQACRGLHAAHRLKGLDGNELGLVHRDISPHNLMCTTDGHVKLLDFGVAKSTTGNTEATYSGNLKGKFAYLSPEQCLHEPLDRRSDIFGMGIIFWEMLTMRRLFKRKTELDMMQAVIGGDIVPPSTFHNALPPAIEAVVMKSLAIKCEDRFDTAEDMRRALVKAAHDSNVDFGEDHLTAFINDIASEKLAERQETIANACKRALTSQERRRLLHLTGSNSRSTSRTDGHHDEYEDLPTIVERPGSISLPGEATRPTPLDGLHKELDADRTLSPDESTSTPPASHRRITLLIALVALIAILVTSFHYLRAPEPDTGGESPVFSNVATSGQPLPLGWAPTVDPDVLREEIEPLHRYLEAVTGRPVPMIISESYGELSEMLLRGEIAFASLPPLLFVETLQQSEAIELLALKEFDGSISSDALLLVRMDSGIRRLSDLEGEVFCFIDPSSTSGYFLPREHIREEGYDPDEFIGNIHWSGDHFQGMRDLIDGKCEATAAYSGAFLSGDEFGIRTGQIRQLGVTGFIPQDTMAAGPEISNADKALLRDALLSFNPAEHLGVARLGQNQRITGFQSGNLEDFEPLRQAFERQ